MAVGVVELIAPIIRVSFWDQSSGDRTVSLDFQEEPNNTWNKQFPVIIHGILEVIQRVEGSSGKGKRCAHRRRRPRSRASFAPCLWCLVSLWLLDDDAFDCNLCATFRGLFSRGLKVETARAELQISLI